MQHTLSKEFVKDQVAIIGYWTEGIFTAEDGLRSALRACNIIDPDLQKNSQRFKSLALAKNHAPQCTRGQKRYEDFIDKIVRPVYFKVIEPLVHKHL